MTDNSDTKNIETEVENDNVCNWGKLIQESWVSCINWKKNNILERKFCIVDKRDQKSIIFIILNEVQSGFTIYSDNCKKYSWGSKNLQIHISYLLRRITLGILLIPTLELKFNDWNFLTLYKMQVSKGTTNILERQ